MTYNRIATYRVTFKRITSYRVYSYQILSYGTALFRRTCYRINVCDDIVVGRASP